MTRLIVLEGADGAGKTTQARRLHDHLRRADYAVHLTREPSDGPIGTLIRRMLTGEAAMHDLAQDDDGVALLFAADRRDHVRREVQPAIGRGEIVISDRWYHSSLVYQGRASDDRWTWVRQLNAQVRVPDLTIILDVPPSQARARREARGLPTEAFDTDAIQAEVTHGYRRTARTLLELGERVELLPLPSDADVDTVAQHVAAAADALLAGLPPRQVYVEGRMLSDRPGVTLRGVATLLDNGLYQSLAEIDGKPIQVETTINFTPRFS